MNLSSLIDDLNICPLTEEEDLRRSKFNFRNYPWITIMKFKDSDEVETWRKFSTPFYLRITHGTYKININRFPVLIFGRSDLSGQFFLMAVCIMSHETTEDYSMKNSRVPFWNYLDLNLSLYIMLYYAGCSRCMLDSRKSFFSKL